MAQDLLQIALFFAIVLVAAPPAGAYMARVFSDERVFLTPVVAPFERLTYKLLRVDPDHEQDWKAYAKSLLVLSLVSGVVLYLILSTQGLHPFHTASSFLTNTNWQFYGGETTMSYFSQMAGLAVQNFLSAAVGIAVLVALIRGVAARHGNGTLGNFYKDITRIVLYILLPLSIVGALVLASQGVVQTLAGTAGDIARGPVASPEAIKLTGHNRG